MCLTCAGLGVKYWVAEVMDEFSCGQLWRQNSHLNLKVQHTQDYYQRFSDFFLKNCNTQLLPNWNRLIIIWNCQDWLNSLYSHNQTVCLLRLRDVVLPHLKVTLIVSSLVQKMDLFTRYAFVFFKSSFLKFNYYWLNFSFFKVFISPKLCSTYDESKARRSIGPYGK